MSLIWQSPPAVFPSAPSTSSESGIVIYLLDTSAISALMRADAAVAAWLLRWAATTKW
ncbi:MAG: hypothetical protein QOJ99_5633 [Bryobacterales bacterium]|nr:hypothetical protein [Bryobacterales bacterium]